MHATSKHTVEKKEWNRKEGRIRLFLCNAPKMDKVAKPPEKSRGRIEFKRNQAPGRGVGGGGGGKL